MSTIMRYQDEVLSNVRTALCAIRDNKGMAPASLLDRYWKEFQGRWNNDTMNVVLVAMGKHIRFEGNVTTEVQFTSLVEKAQRDSADVLHEIKKLREAKGK